MQATFHYKLPFVSKSINLCLPCCNLTGLNPPWSLYFSFSGCRNWYFQSWRGCGIPIPGVGASWDTGRCPCPWALKQDEFYGFFNPNHSRIPWFYSPAQIVLEFQPQTLREKRKKLFKIEELEVFAHCCTENQPGLEAELLQEVGNSERFVKMPCWYLTPFPRALLTPLCSQQLNIWKIIPNFLIPKLES